MLIYLRRCAILAIAFIAPYAPALAQTSADQAWIQLETATSLASAEDRARSYAALGGEVAGFRMGGKWYGIALGPYSAEAAAGRLNELQSAGQIPTDAYITDGSNHGDQFWPKGAPVAVAKTETAPAPSADAPAEPAASAEPAPAEAEAAPADETRDQALDSESALKREEKAELQTALAWYGFYDAKVDGSFGKGTRASMTAWQEALGYEATGVLTTMQRATLTTNYRTEAAAFGFEPVTEPEAGIEFSLPAAMLAFDHYEPPFVHYVAKDGSKTQLVLISEPGDETNLAALFDLLQTLKVVPKTGERALEGKEFTINAADGNIASFATARAAKGAVKGYMLIWEPAAAEAAARILAALKTSFRSTGETALDPGLVPLEEGAKAGLLAGMEVAKPSASASGTYITAEGLALTSLQTVSACGRITLDRTTDAEIIASDAALGAALLRPLAAMAPAAVAPLATTPIEAGTGITVAGYAFGESLPAPALSMGSLEAATGLDGAEGKLTLKARIAAGDAGGPVLNAAGQLIGLITPPASGDKVLPEGIAEALSLSALTALLDEAGLEQPEPSDAAPLTPDALQARAMGATALVSCWP